MSIIASIMNKIVILLVCLIGLSLSQKAPAPGEHHYAVSRPEGEREYFVWVPKSYDGSQSFPLVLSFHGLGDYCQDFGAETGLRELSEQHNFLYAYPCGYPGLLGNAWNAGTCCLNPSEIDDVQLTRDIIHEMMSNTYNITSSRIYACGFSNGAMMSETLACEASDLIQATVSVAGVVVLNPGNSDGLMKCTADYATHREARSTLNIHGDFDFVVPWTGDVILGFPPVPDNFAAWAERNQCVGDPVSTFNKGQYSNQIYQNCANNTVIEVMKVEGGGHSWPSDQYFDTATYIADFFGLRQSQ